MSGLANLIYDEKTLDAGRHPRGTTRSVRYYERADAVIKAGDEGTKPTLRQERRLSASDSTPARPRSSPRAARSPATSWT